MGRKGLGVTDRQINNNKKQVCKFVPHTHSTVYYFPLSPQKVMLCIWINNTGMCYSKCLLFSSCYMCKNYSAEMLEMMRFWDSLFWAKTFWSSFIIFQDSWYCYEHTVATPRKYIELTHKHCRIEFNTQLPDSPSEEKEKELESEWVSLLEKNNFVFFSQIIVKIPFLYLLISFYRTKKRRNKSFWHD